MQGNYWILASSRLLRSVGWFRTDVSGLPIGPIFKDCLAVEDGTEGSPETSVINQPTPRNNPEDKNPV
jgi:hypothetical protein